MIGLRTNQNPIPHDSHRCRTLTSPSPAMTWPTGAISSLWKPGHRRSRVWGSSGSGSGRGRNPSPGSPAVNVVYPTHPMLPGVR